MPATAVVTSSKGESKGAQHVQRLHRHVFPNRSRRRVMTGGGVRRSSTTDGAVKQPPYFTSKSFVPADLLSRNTSTLYFPFGRPDAFEMWNSVYASPEGAIA